MRAPALLAVLCAAVMAASRADAQAVAQASWPVKPVRVVVAFAPGGIADVAARLVASRLSVSLGQPFVVENRAGGGGNLGAVAVARAAPDGYTVLATTTSVAVNPSLSRNAGYELERDLLPVVNLASSPNLIVVHPGTGARNLKQLIEKARGAKLNYGSAGAGTTPHLSAEYLFRMLAKVEVTHVPYKGAGPAIAAALGGEVEIASIAMPPAIVHVKAGRLIGIAVTSRQRVPSLPEVPTVDESGFPGFEDYTWVGLFLPRGAPPEAVARLNAETRRLLATEDMKSRLAALGFEPAGGSPAEFSRYVAAEVRKWARVVRDTGARAD